MYGITVRYNVIKKKLEVLWAGQSGTADNQDHVALTTILSLVALNRMNTGSVPAILETLADRNPHNPVADWIMSKPWDGVDRLEAFYETLVEREDYPKPLKEVLMHRWLISCVAAAMMPQGFYGRGILTLQGPQSIGKTSWIRGLIPDPILREQVLRLDHHLDAGNKDSQITAICHWMVEIGELDSSLKKDVARLKGFITSDRDKLRKPYGRTNSEYQRRTVFCASVNDHAFLVDPTGNTRFWTIPVTKIDYQHAIDMQQLWAQIAVDYEAGEPWWLDRNEEECLEVCNKDHRAVSAIRERLMAAIDHESTASSTKAYSPIRALQKLGISQPSNQQCKEAAGIFRELYGEPKKIQGVYKWRVPLTMDKPDEFSKYLPDPDDDDLIASKPQKSPATRPTHGSGRGSTLRKQNLK
jgi:putative DNA primase/helicase